jgi:protein-S-isoprenylcysteine O-methyltransferase Ste14
MTFGEFLLRLLLVVLTFIYFIVQMVFNRRFPPEETVTSVSLRREIPFLFLTILWPVATILFEFKDFANGNIPALIRYFGMLVYIMGIFLFTWANIVLGKNLSVDLQIRKGHQLIERGPYRRMRHPIYIAWLVCGLGIALMSANWLITLLYFIPVIARILIRLHPEELMLSRHFGAKYDAFRKHTGSLFPK